MGLKQSVVVVNEYSVKTKGGGSRGGTPGDYVLRYMARKGATEDLTPVRLQDTDVYITRYMARRDATETMSSIGEIKQGMRDAQGLGGVAFGNDDVSMSHRKVKKVSHEIQQAFEQGKTVMKTVISFDGAYLRAHGIIDEGFACEKPGDYRGHIDQMKLRLAIMNGMKRMGKAYDDLQWVGVIQVDTMHVHCHICAVDRGMGFVMPDGTQRGKLNETMKRNLRRGIDLSLDEMHPVKMMASSITHDRQNAKCFLKKFTHEVMEEHGFPQFLLACLPEDRTAWRAGTNRKDMQKANRLVRDYVEQVLAEPDSGYQDAMHDVNEYALFRQQEENLSMQETRRLVHNGRERLVQDCMNSVYSILRDIPQAECKVRTPMLDVMSMEYKDMASVQDSDPMLEFGFRLRSYSSRLDYHKKECHKYREARKSYEEARGAGETSPDSVPLYQFYQIEEAYNAMLMAKYQHFLAFLPPSKEYGEEFDELLEYRKRMRRLEQMRDDKTFRRLSEERAEEYGLSVYGMHGGRYAKVAPEILARRQELMGTTYRNKETEFREHLADYGLTLDHTENGVAVSTKNPYVFDEVKMMDIHHLGYDFPFDADISKVNVDDFVRMTEFRSMALNGAVQYLEGSGQGHLSATLPCEDVRLMKEVADSLSEKPKIISKKDSGPNGRHRGYTVSLDEDYMNEMHTMVKATVASTKQFGDV